MNQEDTPRRMPGAYVLTHESTGLFYLGSSGDVRRRISAHFSNLASGRHKSEKLQQAYDHDDEFSVEIMPAKDRETAYDLEQQKLDATLNSPYCLNQAKDARVSRRGAETPEETRRKLSEANTGYKHTPEAVEKIRAAGLGRELSEETKAKISQSHQGLKHSEETKAKMSEAWKNRGPVSEDTRAKLRQAAPKSPVSIEGKVYESMEEASRQLGVPSNTILHRLRSENEKFKDWRKL